MINEGVFDFLKRWNSLIRTRCSVRFLEVLESQRRALQSRSSLLSTRRQALDNRVDLYLALGGGFEESEVDLEAAIAIAIAEGES